MTKVNIYLNFAGGTELAFGFYRQVFGGEFSAFSRFGDVPGMTGEPGQLQRVMHVALPIGDGFVLMGSDTPEPDPLSGQGYHLHAGNNFYVSLHAESPEEAQRLFAALAEGGSIEAPLAPMFWGALYGTLTDRFGIQWMVNCDAPK
jgi:PhnB protein